MKTSAARPLPILTAITAAITVAITAAIAALLPAAVGAAPNDSTPPASGERPGGTQPPPRAAALYGLCSGPPNAEAFPTSPVPVLNGKCEYSQEFKSVSPSASYGTSCGGYTTAFGPLGDLKRSWKHRQLTARWVAEPLTASTCGQARIAAVGWGYRCDNEACSTGAWEQVGSPIQRSGSWNPQSKTCSINVGFAVPKKDWQTLSIDAIAALEHSGQAVRQYVGATIRAHSPNGKCPSAAYTPQSADPPVQAASKVKIQQKYPH